MTKKFFLLLFLLPILILSFFTAREIRKRALEVPANIQVDMNTDLGPFFSSWQAFSQGGEEQTPMLDDTAGFLAEINPRYIRIDHIYDSYNLVEKIEKNGGLVYSWSELDKRIREIIKTGAKPFFSLSYTPPALTQGGITDEPDYRLWQNLVRDTVNRYSSLYDDLYYEVWNEPDLFGQWKMKRGSKKYYGNLYKYAVLGAGEAVGVKPFKIGGPALTEPHPQSNPNWMRDFLDFTISENLRLDFISWHRYHKDPKVFEDDIEFVNETLKPYFVYSHLEKLITEWGSDPGNSYWHDSVIDAAHAVAVIRKTAQDVHLAFTFEIKDGRSPENKTFWGRWGLLTHESAGLIKKPRFYAFSLLNKLQGNRLAVSGEGNFVTALAAKDENKTRLLLVNYDPSLSHREKVPIDLKNLNNGGYALNSYLLDGRQSQPVRAQKEIVVKAGSYNETVDLLPNSLYLLEFIQKPAAPLDLKP